MKVSDILTLDSIKGLGPKKINLLNKIGINNTDDLITFYPFRYDVIRRSDIDSLEQDDKIIMDGKIESDYVNQNVKIYGEE